MIYGFGAWGLDAYFSLKLLDTLPPAPTTVSEQSTAATQSQAVI